MLIAAIVVGAVAFMMTMKLTKPQDEGGVVIRQNVVGVIKDIEIGTTVRREDLDLIPAPDNVDPSVLIKDPVEVVGKIANRFIAQGSVLRTLDLMSAQDSLASLIPQGYQAMTVPVTMPGNLTNLIQVGNRVDVLLTYTTAGQGTQFKSLTLMKNVKVIGVGSGTGNNEGMQITLAVTPEGAKTLAYSLKRGTLNLAVRSLSETDQDQPENFYTLAELFKDQELDTGTVNKEGKVPLTEEIEIVRGLSKEVYKFVDGKANPNPNAKDQAALKQ